MIRTKKLRSSNGVDVLLSELRKEVHTLRRGVIALFQKRSRSNSRYYERAIVKAVRENRDKRWRAIS